MTSAVSERGPGTRVDTRQLLGMPVGDLLSNLNTSLSGLERGEAENRLRIYGRNELVKRKKRMALVEFLARFRSPLVIILLAAGLVSGFLGEVVNATIIFLIVVISVGLDFYQESKAEEAADLLKAKVSTTATVLRSGLAEEVPLAEVVPGDIVLLSAGDIVPADIRIVNQKELLIDQSALTGESFPVEKDSVALEGEGGSAAEWTNCAFMGTSVVGGSATCVVLRTGDLTEYGTIVRSLVARAPETEFEAGLRRFGSLMMEVTFLLVVFVLIVNTSFGRGVLNSLLFAVALAVGLTPELLPMIVSVNLSKGALAMSRKGVIVKRLASIENLGSMDVFCSDKTGTLTENKISLLLHVDVERKEEQKVLLLGYLNSHFEAGIKSALDEAVLRYQNIDVKEYLKIDEVPFDFVRRRSSVVVEREGQRLLITKGAPEEIIKVCSSLEFSGQVLDLTDQLRRKIDEVMGALSSEGMRVLGVSYRKLGDRKDAYSVEDEADMVFLGFLAFMDPPKKTAKASLKMLKEMGVEVKILTGDNDLVTQKTCQELDFKVEGVVLGSEITQMNDDALARLVEKANIFARVTPTQKNRVILALKKNGHVVGYLGDGINDAPSMKTADVGISVNNAVDVAKESADMILLEKRLRVLADGVLEGRRTFGNTMKYIMMGTSSNFGNMISVAGASLFLPFLPMLPIQILLNNLLYDLSESTIPSDSVDPEYLGSPRRLDIAFIRRFMLLLGPISSVFDFLTFYLLLAFLHATAPLFRTAWFLESLSTQTLVIFVTRTSRTPFYRSRPSRLLLSGSLLVVGIALAIPFTPLGGLFGFVEPPLKFLALMTALIAIYLVLAEIAKARFYRRYSHRV